MLLCRIQGSPNLEGQVPEFISLRKRLAQLYPLFIASYNFQGYGGGIRTHLHKGNYLTAKLLLALTSTVTPGSESHETHDLILISDGSGSLQSSRGNCRLLLVV
jgi:hypothetical protein